MVILLSSIGGNNMQENLKRDNGLDNDPIIDSGFTLQEIENNRNEAIIAPTIIQLRVGSGIGGFTLSSLIGAPNNRNSHSNHPTVLTKNQREFLDQSDKSNCKGADPTIFFPEQYKPTDEAKSICGGCSIAKLCLEYAIDGNERHGIWGGTNPAERRKIVKLRTDAKREK
jgi:hypothetical protein